MVAGILATFKALFSGPNLLSVGAYSPRPAPFPHNTHTHKPPSTLLILQSMVLGKIKAQGWGLTEVVGGGLKTSREGWV